MPSCRLAVLPSCRSALKTLEAAALAVAAGGPLIAEAAKGGTSGKGKKRVLKRCKKQVGACTAQGNSVCQGNAECEARLLPCCQLLGNGNATEFVACTTDASAGDETQP